MRKAWKNGLCIAAHDFASKRVVEPIEASNSRDGIAHHLFDVTRGGIIRPEKDVRRISDFKKRAQRERRRRLRHVVVKALQIRFYPIRNSLPDFRVVIETAQPK